MYYRLISIATLSNNIFEVEAYLKHWRQSGLKSTSATSGNQGFLLPGGAKKQPTWDRLDRTQIN